MKNNILYVRLWGRIGNQLFILAAAKHIQMLRPEMKIVLDDSAVLEADWENSLKYYHLKNVEIVHDNSIIYKENFILQRLGVILYGKLRPHGDYITLYKFEKKLQKLLNLLGVLLCENGYLKMNVPRYGNIYMDGYYQSHKYFDNGKKYILQELSLDRELEMCKYPNLELLKNRNSVCISVKVEHNVGSSMYDVCSHGYWAGAIKYITENVDNPLFFICSDNVEYVKEHLIDCDKYDVVCQSKDFPAHISLAAMSKCKHFIIGNTTFGWWAQYMSEFENKIVVAPSRWMRVDMPIDLYEDGWHLIDVNLD